MRPIGRRQLTLSGPLILAIAFSCGGCGFHISDRRVEKVTFPGGEILWNESRVEEDDFCLRHCSQGGERVSVLYMQLAAGLPRERVAELRSSTASESCCLLKAATPVYFKRSGDVAVLVIARNIFTRWGPTPPREWPWSSWSIAGDSESTHFLRHFGCGTFAREWPPRSPPRCSFPDGAPYDQVTLDSGPPVIEIRASRPRAGWPDVIVYSAPGTGRWMFDLDRTLRANHGLRIVQFPRNIALETSYWARPPGTIMPYYKTPDDLARNSPDARVVLARTLPVSTASWMSVWEIPAELAQRPKGEVEYLAAYGDPDPEWLTMYTRFRGWGGHEARFVRIGEWMRMGDFANGESPQGPARFVRLVRTKG